METPVKIGAIQLRRMGDYIITLARMKEMLGSAGKLDFVLLGGENTFDEPEDIDPYPRIAKLARTMDCNLAIPLNANNVRYANTKLRGRVSMHMFDRNGDLVGVQDKHSLYWKERLLFDRGKTVAPFEVEGIKIGLVRGLDLLDQKYIQSLRDAELLFFSTLDINDMMLDSASTIAMENQCVIVMASYIGVYAGTKLHGTAAIIEPTVEFLPSGTVSQKTMITKQIIHEGIIQAEFNLAHIRLMKRTFLHPKKEVRTA